MNLEIISRQDCALNKEIAYLLGVFLSDGSISDCNFQLQVIDKDFAERVLGFWKKIVPTTKAYLRERNETTGWNRQKRYVIKLGIGKYAEWFKGQTHNKHNLPLSIWSQDLVIKKWFIAGIMDGDGWISKTKRNNSECYQYRIGIGGVEEGWIGELKELFQSLGVKCSKTERFVTKYDKWFSRFSINPKSFFDNKMFFTLKRKVERCTIASETAR